MDLDLKILSFNIHKGYSPYYFKKDIGAIKRVIEASQADLVLLQEVRGGKQPQFEHLADEVWSHYAYGRNAVYPKGDHGNVVLSQYPITHFYNLDLSVNRFEKRGMLHVRVEIPQKKGALPLDLFCTHLDLLEHSRFKQIERCLEYFKRELRDEVPAILGGDFNDWNGNVSRFIEKRSGFSEFSTLLDCPIPRTFPSVWPFLSLDRLFIHGAQALRIEAITEQPERWISDHCALLATIRISKNKPTI